MVKIRLSRGGSKKRPYYHIIVADQRNKRDGKHLERLGFFNPLSTAADVENFRVDMERYDYWMSVGAQPSERVSKLVKGHTEDSA
jgi:small subunit ribosomal protein S16